MKQLLCRLLCVVSLALLVAAAVDEDELVQVNGGELKWTACPFELPTLPQAWEFSCLNLTVPRDWSSKTSTKTIPFWLTRLVPVTTSNLPRRDFWMLQGGPGGSGFEWFGILSTLDMSNLHDNNVALILPDHRGTGFSSELYCPSDLSIADCLTYLKTHQHAERDTLRHYNTQNAALDLLYATSLVASSSKNDFVVFGFSYGTYWAQRYLYLVGQQSSNKISHKATNLTCTTLVKPATMIIDGVCPPDKNQMVDADYIVDRVGRDLLSRCVSNSSRCRAAFGGRNPVDVMGAIFTKLWAGESTCMDQLGLSTARKDLPKLLRNTLGQYIATIDQRLIVPAAVFRLERCSADDVTVLTNLFKNQDNGVAARATVEATSYSTWSSSLGNNIQASETTISPPSATPNWTYWKNLDAKGYFSMDQLDGAQEVWASWPRYIVDTKVFGKYPNVPDVPVLILNGDLDAIVPHWWASWAHEHYPSTMSTTFVKVPYSVHGTHWATPMAGTTETCGMHMIWSFVRSNGKQVDHSCLNRITPPDWMGDTTAIQNDVSQTLWGTTDLWGLSK